MILIADSGMTKTDWRLINQNGDIEQCRTAGINPNYMTPEAIQAIFEGELKPNVNGAFEKLHFYGAGCSSEHSHVVIRDAFREVYPNSEVEVQHDLIAAARALCGHQEGIACILGTGANSCLYDGKQIVDNIASVGYVMGDEGSGTWLGSQLLSAFMRRELPENIHQRLVKRFDLSNETIIENVYRKSTPAKYISGFSKFIFQNLKDPYLYLLVHRGFTLFFEKNINRYEGFQERQVHFTGSVAFYYANILRKVASEQGVALRNITENPIAGLTLYHQNSLT
ncbi:MAG: N-acetylglucosamine kinase [Bacteroidota bacterium]